MEKPFLDSGPYKQTTVQQMGPLECQAPNN